MILHSAQVERSCCAGRTVREMRSAREIATVRKIVVLGLLAISLVAPSVHAQTSPAVAATPAASAVDPASIQALKDMGAFLQTLKRFHVSTEVTGERVLADGQKLQHTATADMDVERPNKLRALIRKTSSLAPQGAIQVLECRSASRCISRRPILRLARSCGRRMEPLTGP